MWLHQSSEKILHYEITELAVMARKFLRGLAYELGEEERNYSSIDGLEEAVSSRDILFDPKLLGLGSFFVTKDIYRCALFSVGKSLGGSGIYSEEIDHVILCSSAFKEKFVSRNIRIGELLQHWNIFPKTIRGLSGSGCVDVLSGIDLACVMIDIQKGHNILIVGIESYSTQDVDRLQSYGLISDAAVSIIVTDRRGLNTTVPAFEIVACEFVSQVREIGKGMIVTNESDRSIIRDVLVKTNRSFGDISAVFGNNVFLPVKEYREALAGASKDQMCFGNVARIGHCQGCDTIINLVDFGVGKVGDQYVLYAEAEGHSGCVVVCQQASVVAR